MDDVQAVRRLKNGDIGGLEVLVARYQRKALETAVLITQDQALAEDIVQETFVRIYQRIRRFDESRPFQPYLLRSIVNAALNAVQKEAKWARHGTRVDGDTGEVEGLIYEAISVEDQVELAELKGEIQSALSRLPPRQRVALVQRYYLDMSEKEMAAALQAAPGTIKWLLNTARARLRTLLGSERSAE